MTSSQLLFIPFTTETLTLADLFYDKNSDLSQIIPVMISFIMSLTVDVEVHKTFFLPKSIFPQSKPMDNIRIIPEKKQANHIDYRQAHPFQATPQ